ncbi:TIGR02466 family protein [Jannaschia sp. LMIT008]|uniref:TIGR02466 family protein n=1 Tax=Jannaschia maritima TaxID=3032585 RepID=UPI002811305A|nr:TIGR02466 family protein [Jannaschia sp. LMIT008]
MADLSSLFVTRLYRALLSDHDPKVDAGELRASCISIAEDDEAGQEWCDRNDFPGYTSYASLTDLPWRFPIFDALRRNLDRHVSAFAADAAFDLDGRDLALDDIWINVLPPGGIHTGHLHPHAVVSGTTYVALPDGAGAIRFEDPRLPFMMAAPGRTPDAPADRRTFHTARPAVGDVLLWEGWLRHEVPMNMTDDDRISVSFNYRWG